MIVTFSGMSTAGKSYLASQLMEEGHFDKVVTCTTRNPRVGEVDGEHYYFLDKEKFKQYIQQGVLVEHVESHGNFYGTPTFGIQKVVDAGRAALVVLEPEGVQSLSNFAKANNIPFRSVFIQCDTKTLAQRFFDRIEKQIANNAFSSFHEEAKRLHTMASQEMQWATRWDWDIVLTNTHLPGASAEATKRLLSERDAVAPNASRGTILRPQAPYGGPDKEKLALLIEQKCEGRLSLDDFVAKVFHPTPSRHVRLEPTL
ncbi:guanylate kinase [Pseudomonas aeruginosa]